MNVIVNMLQKSELGWVLFREKSYKENHIIVEYCTGALV
jgi:hypothetical protein